MDWGAAARKRTAQTTSKNMTAITQLPHLFLGATEPSTKKPSQASTRSVRNKIRREALDSWDSFRDGNSANHGRRQHERLPVRQTRSTRGPAGSPPDMQEWKITPSVAQNVEASFFAPPSRLWHPAQASEPGGAEQHTVQPCACLAFERCVRFLEPGSSMVAGLRLPSVPFSPRMRPFT